MCVYIIFLHNIFGKHALKTCITTTTKKMLTVIRTQIINKKRDTYNSSPIIIGNQQTFQRKLLHYYIFLETIKLWYGSYEFTNPSINSGIRKTEIKI